MAKYLRQSTASQEIVLGPFVDSTDGNTAETGLTIANTDIAFHKHGGTTLPTKNSGGGTHISGGRYYAVLDATDTDTLGNLQVYCHPTGALAFKDSYTVLPANVFDALILGTDLLDISLVQVTGETTNVAALATNVNAILADTGTDGVVVASGSKTGYSLTATTGLGNQTANITGNLSGSVGSVTGAVGSVTDASGIADAVCDENLTGHTAANSLGARLQLSHSGACQAGGSGTTVVLASTASSVDDYYNGDLIFGWVTADRTNFFADYITDYVGSTRTATVTGIPVSPGATYTYVVAPGGTIPGATAPSADDNAAAVWNKARASHVTAGSFGEAFAALVLGTGTAQAGGASTVTLAAGESVTNDLFNYGGIALIGGTGAGQGRQITDYVGSSKARRSSS